MQKHLIKHMSLELSFPLDLDFPVANQRGDVAMVYNIHQPRMVCIQILYLRPKLLPQKIDKDNILSAHLLPGFKISVETGTTRPSHIRLDHGRYRTDTRVGVEIVEKIR